MTLLDTLRGRRSTRSFLPEPVPRPVLEQILTDAARAPSAMNMQPWEVNLVLGEERVRLSRKLLKCFRERRIACGPGTDRPLPERIIARARECGEGMAALTNRMGVDFRTYVNEGSLDFYGAPSVALVFLDDAFPPERLADIGIFTGFLLVAAACHGVATCPIGLVRAYEDVIKDHLNIPESETLVLAVAMGRLNPDAAINEFRSTRIPVRDFVRWVE